jgi:hypothetical protein
MSQYKLLILKFYKTSTYYCNDLLKMPKRQRLKEYLWNRTKVIPRQTKYRHTKLNKNPRTSNDANFNVYPSVVSENINGNAFEGDINASTEENNIIGNDHSNSSTNDEIETDEIISTNNYNDDYVNDDLLHDLVEAVSSDEINEKDLATAFLAAFFNGRSTQDSLSDYLTLSNFTSSLKLPTSFNGLSNLVLGKNNSLNYEKSFFCNVCRKHLKSPNNDILRACPSCKSR